MKLNTVINSPPINVTAHSGILSKNPQSSTAFIISSGNTVSSFAGEPSQNIGRSFLKSYAAVCLEGAIVVLACIIFSLFASSPPVVDPDAAAVTMVWSYIGELIFNMLVLVGAVKMSDRVVREMMGL